MVGVAWIAVTGINRGSCNGKKSGRNINGKVIEGGSGGDGDWGRINLRLLSY